jgi:DNA-binding response OmpR family regulator
MSTPTATIMIADQDDSERMFLTENLTADGYAVVSVASRTAALEWLREREVDLVIADVNGDTLDLLDTIRNVETLQALTPNDVPVIVLTRHAHELHLVRVLERGGDDVVAKPFSYPELRARVAAVLRRTAPRLPAARLVAGEIVIDLRRREVTVAGEPVALSATEYELLTALAAEPTRTFTRDELMRTVWGYSGHHTRTLDSHACRLRARLAGAGHPAVVSVWGVGYRLLPQALEARDPAGEHEGEPTTVVASKATT